jgi:nucleoid-associated protein YgaU
MITAKSRYADADIVPQPNRTVAVHRNFPRPTELYDLYTWVASDRLDRVAAARMSAPEDWWRILDANPLIQDPNDIRPGQQIRIPLNA